MLRITFSPTIAKQCVGSTINESRFADPVTEGQAMKSRVIKRSIVIAGRKTSVSLEDAFWKGLREIAVARDMTPSDLVATINSDRQQGNLSSAIRQFVLGFYRAQISDHQGGTRERERFVASSR
jgi:predicted DNA-binding ribbon-helix-helix protein